MFQLSARISGLKESATILMAQKARELKAKGIQVVDLSLGEPDFSTPAYIRQAAKDAIDEGFSHYPPVAGFPELREAISEKFRTENQLDYQPSQIVVSTGAKQTLANIILSLLGPGDEIIVPAPYWVSYMAQIQLAGATPVILETSIESDFKISPEQLDDSITAKTKAFLFSSPCNPTGSVYTESELAALVSVFEKHPQVVIISDEIYEYINFTEKHISIGQFESISDRVVTVNGFSKGYAMTGWRLGYMGAPDWLAKGCTKMQGQFTSGANVITQRAAITALRGPKDEIHKMKAAFLERRDLIIHLLSGTKGLSINQPQGAFYLYPKVSGLFGKKYEGKTIENANDLAMMLLEKAHVSLVTGQAFGSPEYIRISYANSEENLKLAASRINQFIEKLA
jgi:aspartate aminotransferase